MRIGLKSCITLAVLLGLVLCFAGYASAGATASIYPHVTYADVGDTVKVNIWKDAVDSLFDGYETIIRWNSSELQLLTGTAQESVMTANCSNRWWYLTPYADHIFISHVRMCPPNTLVTGPGAMSSLKFKVLREGRLVITKDYFWFTRAGYWIKDVIWQDGVILAGPAAGLGDSRRGVSAPSILVSPNPGREVSVTLIWPEGADSRNQAGSLGIYSAVGRLVRSFDLSTAGGGSQTFVWDGTDSWGARCSPGIYYAGCRGSSQEAQRRIVIIR